VDTDLAKSTGTENLLSLYSCAYGEEQVILARRLTASMQVACITLLPLLVHGCSLSPKKLEAKAGTTVYECHTTKTDGNEISTVTVELNDNRQAYIETAREGATAPDQMEIRDANNLRGLEIDPKTHKYKNTYLMQKEWNMFIDPPKMQAFARTLQCAGRV
jgi:hypothetical protein